MKYKRKLRVSWREWMRRLWNYDPVAMQAEMLREIPLLYAHRKAARNMGAAIAGLTRACQRLADTLYGE